MSQNLKAGQFWQDTINGDLLKILELSDYIADETETIILPICYVRCACYCHLSLFGVQEMKASRLSEDRFKKLGFIKTLWYRWRLR